MLALPGKYTVEMALFHNGELIPLAGPVAFEAKVLHNTTLPDKDRMALDSFFKQMAESWRVMTGAQKYLETLKTKTAYIQQALQSAPDATVAMKDKADAIKLEIDSINFVFDGTPAKASWEEVPPEIMPLNNRLQEAVFASWQSTSAPTETQKMNLKIVNETLPKVIERIQKTEEQLKALDKTLNKLKTPYTPGRLIKM